MLTHIHTHIYAHVHKYTTNSIMTMLWKTLMATPPHAENLTVTARNL